MALELIPIETCNGKGGGTGTLSPVYADAPPKGERTGWLLDHTVLRMYRIAIMTDTEKRKYFDSGYAMVFDGNGKTLYPAKAAESWLELTHIKLLDDEEPPVPPPTVDDWVKVPYRFENGELYLKLPK